MNPEKINQLSEYDFQEAVARVSEACIPAAGGTITRSHFADILRIALAYFGKLPETPLGKQAPRASAPQFKTSAIESVLEDCRMCERSHFLDTTVGVALNELAAIRASRYEAGTVTNVPEWIKECKADWQGTEMADLSSGHLNSERLRLYHKWFLQMMVQLEGQPERSGT